MAKIHFLSKVFNFLISPKSKDKNEARREYILNILLLGCFTLGLVASFINTFFSILEKEAYDGLPPDIVFAITLIVLALYFFSRSGKSRLVAYVFVLLGFFPAVYTSYTWGADIPQALLIYALVIVMAGVLIGTKFAFIVTLVIFFTLASLAYLQSRLIISPDLYWTKDETPQMRDIMVVMFTLGIIMVVSGLFNREIEKALRRARGSEKALKKERDLLEVKVEERTEELKRTQLEKILHLYRLADFGRMTAGLFHDLVSPLTVVSLNLERLQAKGLGARQGRVNNDAKKLVGRAASGTKRMEEFVKSVRKQIQKQEVKEAFFLNQEINQTIRVLDHKAQKLRVKLHFVAKRNLRTYGNPLRFNQLVTNLITNAIDAYEKVKRRKNRKIIIKLSKKNNQVVLTIQDFGCGIARRNLKKIFDPFFTTKSIEKGTGIGLSICKDIVEKEFGGEIKSKSKESKGTIFTVKFPIIRRKN